MTSVLRMLSAFLVIVCAALATAAAQAPPRPDGHGRNGKLEDYNRALGVECSHCHVPDQWQDESKPTKEQARKMAEMVTVLNRKPLRGIGEVSCRTCHAGQTKPSGLAQEAVDEQIARWPESIADTPQGFKMTMAVYSASTGLRCAQCHDPSDWKRKENDKMRMVPRMLGLFSVMSAYMPPTARTQCFTCHKGENKPKK